MKKYFTIVKNNSNKAELIEKKLLNILPQNWIQDFQKSEFIFVIGGDGTFLRNKDYYLNKKIIPINGGNLGFYSYWNKSNLNKIFKNIENEKNFENIDEIHLTIDERKYFALNEILFRDDKVMETKVYINSILLEKYKGTGLLFSTQLGSTAHAKNANGAIIAPNLNVIQMVEIEPLTQKKINTLKSPLILDNSVKIDLKSTIKTNTSVIIDGQRIDQKFNCEAKIEFKKSNFKIFKPDDKKSYWKKLRDSFVRD